MSITDDAEALAAMARWTELSRDFETDGFLDAVLRMSRDELIAMVIAGTKITRDMASTLAEKP